MPAKSIRAKATTSCQGVSRWDEPCSLEGGRHCDQCGLWFCAVHFTDPDWHSCATQAEENRSGAR